MNVESLKLLILGAGGYGRLVSEIASQLPGRFLETRFLDDNSSEPDVVGKLDELESFRLKFSDVIVAMGNPQLRKELMEHARNAGFNLPSLIHPQSYVSPSAIVSEGCVIEPMAVVNANARLGCGTYICAGAVVNHNATVGDYCQIDCNAVVKAGAQVPDNAKIAAGTVA